MKAVSSGSIAKFRGRGGGQNTHGSLKHILSASSHNSAQLEQLQQQQQKQQHLLLTTVENFKVIVPGRQVSSVVQLQIILALFFNEWELECCPDEVSGIIGTMYHLAILHM